MVLSYFTQKDKAPLILDNLSYEILDSTKRDDLKINAFINANGVYVFNDNSKLTKTRFRSKKFKELLKRMQKES